MKGRPLQLPFGIGESMVGVLARRPVGGVPKPSALPVDALAKACAPATPLAANRAEMAPWRRAEANHACVDQVAAAARNLRWSSLGNEPKMLRLGRLHRRTREDRHHEQDDRRP